MSELSYDLVHAAVGANKEKMDKVDLDLPVIPVVDSFVTDELLTVVWYPFIKYRYVYMYCIVVLNRCV